jgi:hypothetical protein
MKHSRVIILLIIAFLVVFQSVDVYSASSLKETETEESVSTECVVSAPFKQVKITAEGGVALFLSKRPAAGNSAVIGAFSKCDLFLQHCTLRI